MFHKSKIYLALFPSVLGLLGSAYAAAQTSGLTDSEREAILDAETIVVQGEIGYRNRTNDVLQTLEYGQEYFQRFEPLTAGDALKRMPSVTFLSDVIESDGVRLRGLDPGYTQITINGEQVPGSNADRSFFMDRIPAELIDRVEIVRSSSASRSGDAMAGTLNIVLRDAYQLDGGYVKAGGLFFDDGEAKESLGLIWGGEVGPGRLILGANIQGRYNPKLKESERYGDSPENDPAFRTTEFDNRETQVDTRDGTDSSFNLAYSMDINSDLAFSADAVYVNTDRNQDERSYEYDHPTAVSGSVMATVPGNLLVDNANVLDIEQNSYSANFRFARDWANGESVFKFGFSNFDNSEYETEDEVDFDRGTPRYTGDLVVIDIEDQEMYAQASHDFDLGGDTELEIGVFYRSKDRDTSIFEDRNRFNLAGGVNDTWNQFQNNPEEFRTPWTGLAAIPGGLNKIEEDRLDLFASLDGESDQLQWEVGLRWETTRLDITDQTVAPVTSLDSDQSILLPSAHFAYELNADDRITGSIARTNRRQRFDYISPAVLEAELGDNDLLGNPNLEQETAWGLDLGYEHRIATSGVVGVNVFYREVSDLVETANTGVEGSEGPGTFVMQPQNTGDGEVYGIEFDLSAPLSFFGMPNTGVFANLSLLDSSITDFMGERQFNSQSDYVYNLGFIQDLPDMGATFGATYRKQGSAFERVVAEEVTTSYGADLEIFIEKRIGERLTIRAVGSNLLDASKDEIFNKFDTIGDQMTRSFDEYELETESAGAVYQIIARMAF